MTLEVIILLSIMGFMLVFFAVDSIALLIQTIASEK